MKLQINARPVAALSMHALLLAACVSPFRAPDSAPEQARQQPESAASGLARNVITDPVPPEDVDVVELATFNEEDLRCYLVRWPASRMVVGEECVLVENQTGSSSFDVNDPFFDPLEWEREILAPGVYRMTRKR